MSCTSTDGAIVTRVGPFSRRRSAPSWSATAGEAVDLAPVLDTVVDDYGLDGDGVDPADQARRATGAGLVTRESDKVLLRRYHEEGDLSAREQLIEQYMSLVRSLARRYSYRGEQLDDLVQIGAIGLIKAIDRFDVNRGVELTTYATPNIIGEIKRHFRDRGWAVRVPRGLQELNVQLSQLLEEQTVQLGRSPTIAELAKAAGSRTRRCSRRSRAGAPTASLSLSAGGGGDEEASSTRSSRSAPRSTQYEVSEDRAVLEPGFRVLDERERTILHLRFFEGLTQSQIAQQVGISQMHVSRLIRRSLEKIREEIASDEPAEPKRRAASNGAAPRITFVRTTAELRAGYRDFFESKGHVFRPSAPLIPRAGRPLDAAGLGGDAAADAVLPRAGGAAGAAPDDGAEGVPHPGHRRGRARRLPPHVLRDARELLVRRSTSRRARSSSPGSSCSST